MELSEESWDAQSVGKSVFVQFFTPWSGIHCKRMKAAWDKLMKEHKGLSTILVADIDCIADGKSKCGEVGVQRLSDLDVRRPQQPRGRRGPGESLHAGQGGTRQRRRSLDR